MDGSFSNVKSGGNIPCSHSATFHLPDFPNIVFSQFMMWANSSPLLNFIFYVFEHCSKPKVRWINTSRDVAFMKHEKSVRDIPVMNDPGVSMGSDVSFSVPEIPIKVASRNSSRPEPTPFGLVHMLPKSLYRLFRRCAKASPAEFGFPGLYAFAATRASSVTVNFLSAYDPRQRIDCWVFSHMSISICYA